MKREKKNCCSLKYPSCATRCLHLFQIMSLMDLSNRPCLNLAMHVLYLQLILILDGKSEHHNHQSIFDLMQQVAFVTANSFSFDLSVMHADKISFNRIDILNLLVL